MPVTFENWVGNRAIPVLATNAGADVLAFQNWRKFKESFAPELVRRAVKESNAPVNSCLDPFGGSGTTSLACQFLGVRPSTIEVNPYLADLIEAKLCTYDVNSLASDFTSIVRGVSDFAPQDDGIFPNAPKTLVEPGVKGRWIFPREIAQKIVAYNRAFDSIESKRNARLFRVLLGGILVELSNVHISGKGRRYRSDWQNRHRSVADLDEALLQAIENAIGDIVRHAERLELSYSLFRGDARQLIEQSHDVDLVLFSPPYPNSFDYTDVYNVELWALGYLGSSEQNRTLRQATLTSHVQVSRKYASAPAGSLSLDLTLKKLRDRADQLWDRNLVSMVGAYFHDMETIMGASLDKLRSGGEMWMVVGDSKYADVPVPVAAILEEQIANFGMTVTRREPFRSMRSSAQQGGQQELAETLIVVSKR